MAINLQSPGVLVKEIDATSVVPSVATSDAGFAAAFLWGPADQITTITSEVELVKIFGKPTTTAVEKNWHVASNFLAYAGSLNVVRTLGDDAKSASNGTLSGEISTLTDTTPSLGTAIADGAISDSATTLNVDAGHGITTTSLLRIGTEILTVSAVNTNALTVARGTNGTTAAAIADDATIYKIFQINQSSGTFDATSTTGSGVITGSGKATFSIATDASGNPTVSVITGGTGFAAGDDVVLTDQGTTAHTVTIDIATITDGLVIPNADDFDSGSISTGTASFVSRYAGALGNSIRVRVAHQSGYSSADEFTAVFDRAPGTSTYVTNRGGAMLDEIHILVEDVDGKLSGTKGLLLEKYEAVSLATDAKDAQGNSNYWKDVLRRDSQYIYGTGQWDNVSGATAWEGKDSNTSTPFDNTVAVQSITLTGGVDATADGNTFSNRTASGKGYNLFDDVDTSDVSLLITGVDEANSADTDALLAEALLTIAGNRKDCVVTMSPNSGAVIGNAISTTKAGDVKDWADKLTSSSYGFADSGWKRTYNRYTDKYVDIPLNGDIAGLMVQTDNSNASWWSPAGFSRGQIKNVVKLWLNPTNADRNKLYKARVNPVVAMPGQGTLLFGDKTLLSKPSAFDRINVRRLFIVLEKSISRAAKSMLFEFNDEFTRASFRNMVEPFLNGIKAQRGIQDYLVVCDTSNNTGDVIDRNEFIGDIFIKPARSINFIQLNFVAVGTGVAFSEVASA